MWKLCYQDHLHGTFHTTFDRKTSLLFAHKVNSPTLNLRPLWSLTSQTPSTSHSTSQPAFLRGCCLIFLGPPDYKKSAVWPFDSNNPISLFGWSVMMMLMMRSLSLHISCGRYSRYSINITIVRLCLRKISSYHARDKTTSSTTEIWKASGERNSGEASSIRYFSVFWTGCKNLGHLIATKNW